MARKARKTASAAKKKKAPRKSGATAGAKKATSKRVGARTKTVRKPVTGSNTGRRKTAARRKRNAQSPRTITGKIASALQAMVDAVADSDLLHGRPHARPRSDTE